MNANSEFTSSSCVGSILTLDQNPDYGSYASIKFISIVEDNQSDVEFESKKTASTINSKKKAKQSLARTKKSYELDHCSCIIV